MSEENDPDNDLDDEREERLTEEDFDDEPEITSPGHISHAILVERFGEQGRRITRHSKSHQREIALVRADVKALKKDHDKRVGAIERWQIKLVAYAAGASAIGGMFVAIGMKLLDHVWK